MIVFSCKYEIAGIGILQNVNVVLCGILTKEAIKILGVHTSYNKKLWDDLNFRDSIKNISNVIRLHEWKFITLQYIKKYVIFKIPNIILGLFPFFYKKTF